MAQDASAEKAHGVGNQDNRFGSQAGSGEPRDKDTAGAKGRSLWTQGKRGTGLAEHRRLQRTARLQSQVFCGQVDDFGECAVPDLRRACPTFATHLLFAAVLAAQGLAQARTTDPSAQPEAVGAVAQPSPLAQISVDDEAGLASTLGRLAAAQLATLPDDADPNLRFRLRLVAGQYEAALLDLVAVRRQRANDTLFAQYEVWLRAQQALAKQLSTKQLSTKQVSTKQVSTKQVSTKQAGALAEAEQAAFHQAFAEVFAQFTDRQAFDAFGAFLGNSEQQRAQFLAALENAKADAQLSDAGIQALLRSFMIYRVYRDLLPRAEALMAADDMRRYVVQDNVLIRTPKGVTLSATRMHKAGEKKQPALMMFNIYADPAQIRNSVREMVANGYAGIVVDARGKRLSNDAIAPYEHEGEDAHAAIDWISKQDWNDGRVAMIGGSYSGFAQWAAARHAHPALKAIVPAVAAIPGQGVPMENNIFLNVNYAWPFYVANNRLLDNAVYSDRERWATLNTRWFESGRPHREIDAVDGTPNPWLQKWLKHPGFDTYWQNMIPWGKQYANINIPVLSITGYFDDGQISALQYYDEHLRNNPRADHTLLMGPWDHFGAQGRPAPELQGYRVDPAAVQPVSTIIYQWLDHILKGGERPALLADRVNLQIMGSNSWLHASSLAAATPQTLQFHLQPAQDGRVASLVTQKPDNLHAHAQVVNLADRKTQNNRDYYPWPIVRDTLDVGDAPVYISEPLAEAVDVVGRFSADLVLRINKRDVDIGLTLYEYAADGSYFHLGYFLGRASYANDPAKRQLLTPGAITRVPVVRSRMTAKRVAAGSRLVLVADVNKNENAQVNHGTGKDVSDERAEDGKVPLNIEWLSDSVLRVPVRAVQTPR